MDEPHDDRDPEQGRSELSGFAKAMHAAEPYMAASSSLIGGVVLGVVAGYFADRKLGTEPWLLVAGACLGLAVGMYSFIRAVLSVEKRKRRR